MDEDDVRRGIKTAVKLKQAGWNFRKIDGFGWVWVDPVTDKHHHKEDALGIQRLRDRTRDLWFKKPELFDKWGRPGKGL